MSSFVEYLNTCGKQGYLLIDKNFTEFTSVYECIFAKIKL